MQNHRFGLERHSYLFAPASYTVRDAIYGSVPLTAAAYATLDTQVFQRLKHIKQVGPAYLVYPGATHTRFSHSIGVYHLVRLALQHLTTIADIEPEVGRATLAAGLLHDVGHFPYSHLLDELSFGGLRLSHADLSVFLIEHDEEVRRVLMERWEVDPALIVDLLSGRLNPRIPPFLYTLVDGPMDMDKLDYLNRDAHHTGVPYGKVEVQRLIDFLAVDEATGRMVVKEAGVGTVESVIFAKYLMFRYVYWHHAARIAGTMFNRAVFDALMTLGITELTMHDPVLRQICMSTDATVEATLAELLREAGVEPPASFRLLQDVDARRLFKRGLTIACSDAPALDRRLRNSLAKRDAETQLAERLLSSGPLSPEDPLILIDVPPTAKFTVDVAGVAVDGGSEAARIVSWEGAPRPSYLTESVVSTMEQSIRFLLFVYNPHRPEGETLRRGLEQHPELVQAL